MNDDDEPLSLHRVLAVTGLLHDQLELLIAQKAFPQPTVNAGHPMWHAEEIETWKNARRPE